MGSLWKDGIAKDERAQERRRLEERLKWSQHLDPTGQEHTGLSRFGEFCQCLLALSPREACKSTRIPYWSIKCLQKKFRQLVSCIGGCPQQPLCQPWGTSKSRSSFPECCWLLQASPGLLLGNNHTWVWRQAEHLGRVRSAGPELQSITPHCLKAVADHSKWNRCQRLSGLLVVRAPDVALLLSLTLCSGLLLPA